MNTAQRQGLRGLDLRKPLALGGALLWGVFEFVALWRSRGTRRQA